MTNAGRSLLKGVAMFATVAVLGACATMNVGRDFNYGDFVSRAKQGETTREQVREWLGAPAGTGMVLEADGAKNDQWTYYSGSGKLPSGAETKFKLLQIKFSTAGKLLSYTWSGDIGAPSAPVEAKETK